MKRSINIEATVSTTRTVEIPDRCTGCSADFPGNLRVILEAIVSCDLKWGADGRPEYHETGEYDRGEPVDAVCSECGLSLLDATKSLTARALESAASQAAVDKAAP